MKNSFIADKEKRLLQIMQDAKGNSLDVYFVIYQEYLLCSENPETFLRMILEFPDKIGEDDGISEKISPEEEYTTIQQYQTWLTDSIVLLIEPNDSADLFYKHLWQSVFCSPTSPKEITQCAVILKLLNEKIPFFHIIKQHNCCLWKMMNLSKEKNICNPVSVRLCTCLTAISNKEHRKHLSFIV